MFQLSVLSEQENTMRHFTILVFIFFAVLWVRIPAIAADKTDLLDIASGSVLISATSEYNQKWAGMLLLDGTTDLGWCSKKGSAHPNTFVIELPSRYTITSFSIDNTNVEESGYPGISAKGFKLYVSDTSASEGYKLILEGEAAKGQKKGFTVQKSSPGQWLKLEVLSNWGDPSYTEMMELEAYGILSGAAVTPQPIKGVYDTNYNLMRLLQSGTSIEGCYDWDNGTLSGTTDGRVIRFQWVEDGPQVGTAMMVLTSDGSFLNGLWYENGLYKGLWYGTRVTDGRAPKCGQGIAKSPDGGGAIGQSLDKVGRAIIYGIYFDYDASTIKPASRETLLKVLEAIKARPDLKLVIEGHTDADGSDTYNQALSEKRAGSVVEWLVANGIAPGQLTAKGYGESRPVADNSKPDGRALNRRVEIAIDK